MESQTKIVLSLILTVSLIAFIMNVAILYDTMNSLQKMRDSVDSVAPTRSIPVTEPVYIPAPAPMPRPTHGSTISEPDVMSIAPTHISTPGAAPILDPVLETVPETNHLTEINVVPEHKVTETVAETDTLATLNVVPEPQLSYGQSGDFFELLGNSVLNVNKAFFLAKIKPQVQPLIVQMGLTWEDIYPVFQSVKTTSELREIARDPNAFLRDISDKASLPAKKFLIAKLKAPLGKILEPLGISWYDMLPVLEFVGTAQDIRDAIANPAQFIHTLENGTFPIAQKFLRLKLKPLIIAILPIGVSWDTDIGPIVGMIDNVKDLRAAIANPHDFLFYHQSRLMFI